MRRLSAADRRWLSDRFGSRATFDRVERILYGHDIAEIPALVRPLAGRARPAAVVQPVDEAELADLVRWAAHRRIPIVPRGKATSGYGGVIPLRGGIVVDFYRMRAVVSIDRDRAEATVEPGIGWEALDRALQVQGLTLRLYPTSYPSSTVGGWLAQGGAGIGSYEFGWFIRNVVSVRLLLPSGEIREVSGRDLELVSEAEGTTGLITRVTLQVQPREDLGLAALSFPGPASLAAALGDVGGRGLPLWSVLFINPRMAALRNAAPLRTHQGHPAEARLPLPETYIALLAFRARDGAAVRAALPAILAARGGTELGDGVARQEWEHRFNLMIVKRLGPSLVPAEVVVPLRGLAAFLADVETLVRQPVVKEGVLIRRGRDGEPEAVLLGFIPSDQRRLSYNFVFALTLSIVAIAKKHGGRPYATGMYFTAFAPDVLGRDEAERLRAFRAEVDPLGILNPGKVTAATPISRAVALAARFERILRPFGNRAATRVGERLPRRPVRGVPADVAWYAYACSQCGYCVDECDQFYGRGWESQSPRGKWYWLRRYLEGKERWDQKAVDTFLVCTTCELCNLRCSASLPIEPSWMKLRGRLIHEEKRMTFPPFEMMAAATRAEGDIWAGYRKDRTAWFPKELEAAHGPARPSRTVYFAGCTASYVEHDIGQAAVTLLDAAGVEFSTLGRAENCCGTPMLVAGKWDVFEETMRKNVAAVKAAGADTVVTSCPACNMMWRHVYPEWAEKLGLEYGIAARHYSELVAEKIRAGEFAFPGRVDAKVTWHDSCHIGRVSGVYEAPRDVIRAIPGVEFREMAHHHEEAHCCGSVLTLIKEPPVAAEIGKSRLDEAAAAGADTVLALCPCCEFQLRVTKQAKGIPVEVHDLAAFACRSLGKTFADPSPEVARQWAVFDAMIALMTPRGFADLMDDMWPEMLRAMPLGMGGMMRRVGRMGPVGGLLLGMMKPVFPVLFPKLLPGMMPKVMPAMLDRVAARVPMPGYMAEQMPAMMPKVMDALMPHMIDDLVPLAVPKMIAFLRGRRPAASEAPPA